MVKINNRKMVKRLVSSAVAAIIFSGAAHAIPVQVDWSATVTPVSPGDPNPGNGTISGSFGIFDVNAVGDTFVLPGDGSLSATVADFTSGFPNGAYSFTRETANQLMLEFSSVGPTSADFSAQFFDNNAGILSTTANPCTIGMVNDNCFISIFDDGAGNDIVVASIALNGTNNDSSIGEIVFSFTVLPTNDVPIPGAIWLFGIGAAGLAAAKRKNKHTSN